MAERQELGEASVKITADDSALNKSLNRIEKNLAAAGKRMQSLGRTLSLSVTTPIVALGALSIKAASDAEETASKFAVVFKAVGTDAEVAAKRLKDSYGLSSKASKQLLSDTGDLLTGFGFSGKAALDLSIQVNELAVDLASFTNFSGGAEGASAALTKALLGERESVKSLGISILDVDVQARVLANTKKGLTFETERQAKAYATLQIAQEQSKNAIGDFARTSDSFANQTRILTGKLNDLSVELGTILLPAATKMVKVGTDLTTRFSGLEESTKKATVATALLAAAIGPALVLFGTFLRFVASSICPLKAFATGTATGTRAIIAWSIAKKGAILRGAALVAVLYLAQKAAKSFSDEAVETAKTTHEMSREMATLAVVAGALSLNVEALGIVWQSIWVTIADQVFRAATGIINAVGFIAKGMANMKLAAAGAVKFVTVKFRDLLLLVAKWATTVSKLPGVEIDTRGIQATVIAMNKGISAVDNYGNSIIAGQEKISAAVAGQAATFRAAAQNEKDLLNERVKNWIEMRGVIGEGVTIPEIKLPDIKIPKIEMDIGEDGLDGAGGGIESIGTGIAKIGEGARNLRSALYPLASLDPFAPLAASTERFGRGLMLVRGNAERILPEEVTSSLNDLNLELAILKATMAGGDEATMRQLASMGLFADAVEMSEGGILSFSQSYIVLRDKMNEVSEARAKLAGELTADEKAHADLDEQMLILRATMAGGSQETLRFAASMGLLKDSLVVGTDGTITFTESFAALEIKMQEIARLTETLAPIVAESVDPDGKTGEQIKNLTDLWADMGTQIRSSTENMIASFIRGKTGFKDMARSMLDTLADMAAEFAASQILQYVIGAMTGGSFAGQAPIPSGALHFGGPRAKGGPVNPGRMYLVDERGPEMFAPPSAGSIISNDDLGGGSRVEFHQTIQVAAGTPGEVRAQVMAMMPTIREESIRAVTDAVQRGGSVSAMMAA